MTRTANHQYPWKRDPDDGNHRLLIAQPTTADLATNVSPPIGTDVRKWPASPGYGLGGGRATPLC